MCGIAGIKRFKGGEISKNILSRLGDYLKHRGPDDRGLWIDQKNDLYLVHTRLSIIDLSAKAHQPMKSAHGKYVIVFNGEIYNYKNIRENLKRKNHQFLSDSDTEVILKAYQEWGEDCLEHLNGMFSFCIWDRDHQSLFLARDRFGIKPLYYYFDGGDFIFASEIKAIITSGLVNHELDHESAGLFLSLGYIPAPKTIYKQIFSLEPGHFLEMTQQGIRKKRYYDQASAFSSDVLDMTKREAVQRTRAELIKSVQCHLVSDVEVGSFLSGGADSSSLVSLMRQVGQNNIKTVSIVFPGTSYDESKYAALVSQTFGTKHVEVTIEENDFFNHLETLFDFMDQPTVDGINTYFVSLAAKRAGLKAILSGIGGDEFFGGYPSFKDVPKLFHLFDKMEYIQAYFIYRGLFTKNQIEKILIPELIKEAWTQIDSNGFSRRIEKFKDDFSKVSFLESIFYMSGQLLRDVDAFSMAHSLEVRVPFVNHHLIEALSRIPSRYRMSKPSKKLLIDAVGDLPEEIYRRPKQGFDLPIDSWLRGERGRVVIDELTASSIYNRNYIQELLKKFRRHNLHGSRIWSLIVLNRFFRNTNHLTRTTRSRSCSTEREIRSSFV